MLVRVESHPYGPRCWVLGWRLHHYHWGFALIFAGSWLIAKDRDDIHRRSRA